MKTNKCTLVLLAMAIMFIISGCGATLKVKNINNDKNNEIDVLVQPHQSLGIEPTTSVRRGETSSFMVIFHPILFGEYFPGRLRWNSWTISEDGSEHFGQVVFAGMHPDGNYFGINIVDGQVVAGQTAILSSAVDYIYSPTGKELPVEVAKFLTDPKYRREKIEEVNKDENGKIFNLSSLTRMDFFRDILKSWNPIKYPQGYLLSPYGVKEVAMIRGVNPQYGYFEKLVGTGKFCVSPVPNPVGFAISNSIGIAMDMIGAINAPTTGWDFNSELPNRRNMAFIIKYLLLLAQKEIQQRNDFNAEKLKEALSTPREEP